MHGEEELETVIRQLRRGRGLAIGAGSIGITLATATDPQERADFAEYLTDFISRFCAVVDEIERMRLMRGLENDCVLAFKEVKNFAGEIRSLSPQNQYVSLSRDFATQLTTRARDSTMPAFHTLIRKFEADRADLLERKASRIKEQTAQLEKMFGEVEDIGRMIHLISLNASVEAARAGGESGRSFKVIADEIRGLAAKSAQLIDTTREALRRDGGGYG